MAGRLVVAVARVAGARVAVVTVAEKVAAVMVVAEKGQRASRQLWLADSASRSLSAP